jgi:hypothetical protein
MPNKQKAKGSNWERDVARFLSDLYKESFIRAPGSGAYVGGQNTVRKEVLHEGQIRGFKGDIIPGQSFPKFNAECKSYKDFPFHQLLTHEKVRMLEDWLDQLMDAADDGDFNILIMKFNNKGKFIATPGAHQLITSRQFTYNSPKHKTWHITGFEEFFQRNADRVKTLCA